MQNDSHPTLTLSGFGVAFGKRVVLDGITLSLLPQGIAVLMGPVKSGKSTLLRTLSGLYDGHALHKSWGDVALAGAPLSVNHRPRLVLQHASVFDQTLLQSLLEPIRQTRQHSPAEWQRLGLLWLTENGLAEYAGVANQALLLLPTRVQRAVLILAQALCATPLLLIDEPTYGLGDADALWLIDWLKARSFPCKLWVALHNQMQAQKLADEIVLIGGGHVLAQQSGAQFFQRPANELVAQFIRTGSVSLPAPDATAADLSDDVSAPPPLSEAARAAIAQHQSAAQELAAPVAAVSPAASVPAARAVVPTPAVVSTLYVAPVELPATSRDGVEVASSIGEVIFRDHTAPRGFHWIVPGKLAGCPAPGVSAPIDYDLKLLAKTGITKLITLTETDLDQAALQRHYLSNLHMPIFDREAPSVGQTHMLLVRMQRMMDAGEILAVHCKAGLGRTGTILAAWMIREGGLSADNSMARLRRIEPGFIQSAAQENFLREYEADLTNRLI